MGFTELNERGVSYSRTPDPNGMFKPFIYNWLHIPSGKKGHVTVYCSSHYDFLKLLDWWNHSDKWKYSQRGVYP